MHAKEIELIYSGEDFWVVNNSDVIGYFNSEEITEEGRITLEDTYRLLGYKVKTWDATQRLEGYAAMGYDNERAYLDTLLLRGEI
jgi:hypothetical protein